jgi:hypothetical protein
MRSQGTTPALLILDPELVKCVVIKDFSHFADRGIDVRLKDLVFVNREEMKDCIFIV